MKNRLLIGEAIAAAISSFAAPSALANGELQIYVGGTLEYDSGSQTSGIINENYSNGGVSADVQAAWEATLFPSIDLDQIDINGAGTVKIVFSSNNNIPSGAASLVNLAVSGHDFAGGTLNGTVAAYWSAGNTLLSTTTLIASENTLLGNVVNTGSFDPTAPYALTEIVNITSGSGDMTTDDSITVTPATPDGGMTVAMLGGVMTTFAIARRRANKKN